MWENSRSPSVAAGFRTAGSRTSRDTTAPQWSSTIWDRPPRITPIGVSTMGSVISAVLAGCGRARAPAGVWLLRCRLAGGVVGNRWFSVAHGRAPVWAVVR